MTSISAISSERSVAKRAAWLDALLNRSPIGIAVTVDRVMTEVNDHFCDLLGYRRAELIGQSVRMLHCSDEEYRRLGEAVYPPLRSQPEMRTEARLRCKDGRLIDLAFSAALVDPERPELGVVHTLLDITEQRRAEQLLQARIALSEHAAQGAHRDLITGVLAEAIALTQSTAARLDFSYQDQENVACRCSAQGIQGDAGLECSIQVSPQCPCAWGEGSVPPGERMPGDGHWPPDVTGMESPEALRGHPLEINAASQASNVPEMRLTVGGKSAPYTPSDSAYLEQLASMAQDALGTLRTQAALRISERRAQLALAAAHDGVWDWDVPSGRIAFNGAYVAMLGEEDAEGRWAFEEWCSRIHPHDWRELEPLIDNLLKEASVEIEYRLRHANGGWCWVQSRAMPVECDAQGRARRVIGTHTDITRIKEAERAAVQMRTTLEAALASMSDAVFISDADGNLVHMNQAFATFHRFAGLDECAERLDAYPGLLEVSRLDGTLVPLSQWAVTRALRGETAVDQRYRLRRKDTGDAWVGSYNLGPIRDADGHVIGAVVTGRDLTQQHAAEQALRASEERFRTLVDRLPCLWWSRMPRMTKSLFGVRARQTCLAINREPLPSGFPWRIPTPTTADR